MCGDCYAGCYGAVVFEGLFEVKRAKKKKVRKGAERGTGSDRRCHTWQRWDGRKRWDMETSLTFSILYFSPKNALRSLFRLTFQIVNGARAEKGLRMWRKKNRQSCGKAVQVGCGCEMGMRWLSEDVAGQLMQRV